MILPTVHVCVYACMYSYICYLLNALLVEKLPTCILMSGL